MKCKSKYRKYKKVLHYSSTHEISFRWSNGKQEDESKTFHISGVCEEQGS